MKNVAIVGIQGLPAKYGGFETLVENIVGEKISDQFHYTIFCSKKDYKTHITTYKGATIKYIPFLHANGVQSTPYDILSLCRTFKKYDIVLVLGVSGCIFLPLYRLFYHKKLIINIDGLEHKRGKWGKWTKNFLKLSEAMAIRYADIIIADNPGIQSYVGANYHKESTMIAYGGDHVKRSITSEMASSIKKLYNVENEDYALSLCRIEPENNCDIILETFSKNGKRFIFIGNWDYSQYGRDLKATYEKYPNITLINSLYDLDHLYVLRSYCKFYIHGHSAGGTNPSLVEAMFFKVPIFAFDVVYNRETTCNKAFYFKGSLELNAMLNMDERTIKCNADDMYDIAINQYKWKHITRKYEECFFSN